MPPGGSCSDVVVHRMYFVPGLRSVYSGLVRHYLNGSVRELMDGVCAVNQDLFTPNPPEDTAGQSGINPFASVGTVAQLPASAMPESQGGDLAAPVIAAVVGIIIIASLLRKLVQ